MLAALVSQFVDPNPSPGNQFGALVLPLSSGNVVVASPGDDYGATNAGAVYLFNGQTGALISALRGSSVDDSVGLGGLSEVGNGNFVVASLFWDNGSAANAGAVTWGSGTSGVKGYVSAANSLVGSSTDDLIGNLGITVLTNGNYVVRSPSWDNGASSNVGAVTWGSGATGVRSVISTANSLIGGTANDQAGGSSVIALKNGNYVVGSGIWDNGPAANAGAATWGSGTTGIKGLISETNSLVGTSQDDFVGSQVTALTNGNYVVSSSYWDNGTIVDAGAATWGSGVTGTTGVVSADNSLVGSTAIDMIGFGGLTPLTNGNYVVRSFLWDDGATPDVGAVTWGSGATGIKGTVSPANSLVGSAASDFVGSGSVAALTNGNYVALSPDWDSGATVNVGAATWGSGATGVKGTVSIANSLVGSTAHDRVGLGGATVLTNGNYVVNSLRWGNGTATAVGAVTWRNGTMGTSGVVDATNSLVGSTLDDFVGSSGVTALSNGNYVVRSAFWDNGGTPEAGAATWGSGTTGVSGVVSVSNSLVGSSPADFVGTSLTALTNGNYVVSSGFWNNGTLLDVGAATWGSGTAGVKGTISVANSLVGGSQFDSVAISGVTALTNGNYVVRSPAWSNAAGAATWGSGATGIKGIVNADNSLVGGTSADFVGNGEVIALDNGNYVVNSPGWDNGSASDAGAITWGDGATGISGTIDSQNSALGAVPSTSLQSTVVDDVNDTFLARFMNEGGGTVRLGSQYNGFLPAPTIGNFGSSTLTYKENAAALRVSTTATVSDFDSDDFSGGELRVLLRNGGQSSDRLAIRNEGTGSGQINVLGTQVRYGTIVLGTFAGGSGTTPLVVTLTDQATPVRVQALLRNITYRNVSDVPSTATRTVRVTLSDGSSGTSNPVFKRIAVQAVNDAPVLNTALNSALATIIEDATNPPGTLISSLLSGAVTDPDAGAQRGIAITSASNFSGVWQYRRANTTAWLPVGSVSEIAARLLPSSARVRFVPKANFHGTVKLYYRAWDLTQGTSGGTFDLTGNLGGTKAFSTGRESATLTVTPVNDAPLIGLGGTIGYVRDSSAITLAASATVTDVDSPNFSGGVLRVRISDGASAANRLAIGSGFTVDANNNVLQGSTIIGKRVSNGFGTKELNISFNSRATPAIVQQLVRSITFKTVGGAAGVRKVLFTLSDGDGRTSDEAIKTVNVK